MTVYTTLNQIRAFEPCKGGWETLLSSLSKTAPDDNPLSLVYILESIGLDGALWCTRTVFDEHREKIVTFAIRCAEHVLPIFEKERPDDLRPRQAIQAAKDYLEGKITKDDLEAAWAAAAAAAAVDAADAAWAADAADDAAWAAEAAAADVAAWAAEKQFQENLFREIFG